jgi:hypothetical protein
MMISENAFTEAQRCLTVISDGREKKVIDIESLLSRHSQWLVLDFLKRLSHEYQKLLMKEVVRDKTSFMIDEYVSRLFRVHMAIRAIENNSEERDLVA